MHHAFQSGSGLMAVALLALCSGCAAQVSTTPAQQALQKNNLIQNGGFRSPSSLPWVSEITAPALGETQVKGGALCTTITNSGTNAWDVQVRQRQLALQTGHTYTVSMRIWADRSTAVRAKVGMAGPPYTEYFAQNLALSSEPQQVKGQFVMKGSDDPSAELALHMGGSLTGPAKPITVCIDDVFVTDPQFTAPPPAVKVPTPAIRLNQVGYFPQGRKVAGYVSDATKPLTWQLLQGGKAVASGQTEPLGRDKESGDAVHLVDFSGFGTPGDGYVLAVGSDQSTPFRIAADLYQQLTVDAMNFFYQNRSGIAITLPYARQPQWQRPAGHATSDKSVPCHKTAGCNYRLDVTGGWYDAGDHGKYVVNGGISVWTLLNLYERNKAYGDANTLGDRSLTIPESGNGVSDLLDEVRWQLEFLLKMQVPADAAQAGMVHLKIHDEFWTALGIRPDDAETKQKRFLHPVSTSATLNLAAVGAQAARLWRGIDDAFAARCLAAAERAWAAAKKNPAVYAKVTDGNGGGAYEDDDVKDEFFWAAAELFITTGQSAYRTELLASSYWSTMTALVDGVPSPMNWAKTDAMGTISLAIVPNKLSAPEREQQRKKVLGTADSYLALVGQQAYRYPFNAGPSGKYPWGSTSFVANNAIMLSIANDLAPNPKYVEASVLSLDYLLGRNGLGQSYVSGYGSKPLLNPHHRFWAKQANSRFPGVPPGVLSGGPNSSLQDPYVKAMGIAGCPPQKCYADHGEAWSVNEVAINWNAPLVWITSYLNSQYLPKKTP
ncbi:MAG: glycoside hydrolase family 9 protein [Rhodoferax sp.]|nr:glycoside hydrolase family 9 protein [Rhodoferax sp.]